MSKQYYGRYHTFTSREYTEEDSQKVTLRAGNQESLELSGVSTLIGNPLVIQNVSSIEGSPLTISGSPLTLTGSPLVIDQPAITARGAGLYPVQNAIGTLVPKSYYDAGEVIYGNFLPMDSNGGITIPEDGFYVISYQTFFDEPPTSNAGERLVRIQTVGGINGNSYMNNSSPAYSDGGIVFSASAVLELKANEVLTMEIYQNANRDVDFIASYFSVCKVAR